jgi:hypothetical protein
MGAPLEVAVTHLSPEVKGSYSVPVIGCAIGSLRQPIAGGTQAVPALRLACWFSLAFPASRGEVYSGRRNQKSSETQKITYPFTDPIKSTSRPRFFQGISTSDSGLT